MDVTTLNAGVLPGRRQPARALVQLLSSPLSSRRRLPIFLPLLLLVLVAAAPASTSATTFPPFGASGDASFSDTCPAGEYLVGLRVRSGAWLDQMAISCRSLTGDLGGPYYGPARGGNGGAPSEGHCPGGYIIHSMRIRMTPGNRQVVNFTFYCELATDWHKKSIFDVGSKSSYNTPVPPQHACPDGEAATGIAGRYGKHVNAVGLICSKLVLPPAPGPTSPQPK